MTISGVIVEALKDITSWMLVNCCDHIQVACSSLIAMNVDMKRKLETVRFMFHDLTETYARTMDEKIITIAAAKESLPEVLDDGLTLMNKVDD